MKESVTYQAIIEEGEVIQARRALLQVGAKRLGPVTPEAEGRIQSIESVAQLETLLDRVFAVETWDDLLRATE